MTRTIIFRRVALALLVLLSYSCQSETTPSVSSPDGRITAQVFLDADGQPHYTVQVDGRPLIDTSALGFATLDDTPLSTGFRLEGTERKAVDEIWTQPWGENKTNRDHHNELAIHLTGKKGVRMTVRLRLFDDGLGFRYEVTAPQRDSILIGQELTQFHFCEDGTSWSIPGHWDTYELDYTEQKLSEVSTANTPFTWHTDSGIWGSIHEAALYDFAEMTLTRDTLTHYSVRLAPWADGVAVRASQSFTTSWRTIQIGRKAVDLINSPLILNLNEPSKISDTSYIRPMRYVGVWWGMHLGIESWDMEDNRHGATTANAIKYIDFAHRHGIEGVLFEGWNEGWESWGGRQHFGFTKPYSDFDMDSIVRYAASKGVALIGHHETGGNVEHYEAHLDSAMRWYAERGVHAVKTGYAGGFPHGEKHHGQYGVRHYQKVVETAAKYGITINAHEPIKDTGIRRTWPNMMTREGARGMEWNAWSEGNSPRHLVTLPFTRLLSGPMDYTPGVFDILYERTRDLPQRKKWNDLDQGNSRVNSTLAHQLADWVVLYSPLQMASDLVEHYEGHPAFQFFLDYDADIDESRALAGEPGQYIVQMRRAGKRYYIGATTGDEARTVEIPLDFLPAGQSLKATIYADGADADWRTRPLDYTIEERTVTSADRLSIHLASGGGCAIFIR